MEHLIIVNTVETNLIQVMLSVIQKNKDAFKIVQQYQAINENQI